MPSLFFFACVLSCVALVRAQSISLGAAATYGVLAGTNIVNIGITNIEDSLAVFPGSSIVGFPRVFILESGLWVQRLELFKLLREMHIYKQRHYHVTLT
jgi:hypothetical protein